jgi:hypothetical protein
MKKKDDFLPRKKSSFMPLLRPALPADENFSRKKHYTKG